MKRILLTSAFIVAIFTLFGATALHVVPQELSPGQDVELLLEITSGEQDIQGVEILYSVSSSSIRQKEPMRAESTDAIYWRGIIPKTVVMASEIEYRFEITLKNGKTEIFPPEDGMAEPYILRPVAPKGKKSSGFVLISNESTIPAEDGYVLAVSFFALQDDIDRSSIRVYVDDKDVTSKTAIEGSVLMYREKRPQAGLRTAIVTAKVKGQEVYSDTWMSQVLPGSFKSYIPFDYRGSINFAANIYDVSKDDFAANSHLFGGNQKDYSTWADLYASYGILDLQTHLLFSSLEDKNQQPINRYMFGLQLPSLDVFLGDYTPNLSSYTLSGKNVRGAYFNLYAKYLKFIVSHGEAMRMTTDEDSQTGTFRQESFGTRLQFGSDDGFRIGMNLSRHRDMISSLDEEYYLRTDAAGDTTYAVTAKDNAVLAIDMQLNVPDQNVMMGFEVAGSLLNNNTIPGVLTEDDLAEYTDMDIPFTFENLADLFVINKNMEPFIPSFANLAWNAYARMYVWNNLINIQYNSVGPAFNSFGSYYQANDTKTLSISDQITIGRFFVLNGGYSKTEDNIREFNTQTNTHQNIFAQMILRIPNMPYLKASFFDNTGENEPLNADDPAETSLFAPYVQKSRNMSFGLGYNFRQIPFVPTQFDISYRLGNSTNESAASIDDPLTMLRENKTNGISLTMLNKFQILPLRTHFSFSNSDSENLIDSSKQTNNSLYARADYSIWDGRIIPFASYRNNLLSADDNKLSYSYFNFGIESYPIRDMSLSFDVGTQSFKNKNDNDKDYQTTTLKLLLSQRF